MANLFQAVHEKTVSIYADVVAVCPKIAERWIRDNDEHGSIKYAVRLDKMDCLDFDYYILSRLKEEEQEETGQKREVFAPKQVHVEPTVKQVEPSRD